MCNSPDSLLSCVWDLQTNNMVYYSVSPLDPKLRFRSWLKSMDFFEVIKNPEHKFSSIWNFKPWIYGTLKNSITWKKFPTVSTSSNTLQFPTAWCSRRWVYHLHSVRYRKMSVTKFSLVQYPSSCEGIHVPTDVTTE